MGKEAQWNKKENLGRAGKMALKDDTRTTHRGITKQIVMIVNVSRHGI